MRKVSFAFPPDLVDSIDAARGDLSRNQFVTRILKQTLRADREAELARTTAEVYSDPAFAADPSGRAIWLSAVDDWEARLESIERSVEPAGEGGDG